MIERVVIVDDYATRGHRLVVLGSEFPSGPRSWLNQAGEWEPLDEQIPGRLVAGYRLPEGVLDAIADAVVRYTGKQVASDRHLDDTITVRDRLLTMVERLSTEDVR